MTNFGMIIERESLKITINYSFIKPVDDVFTTGATVSECSTVLKEAGAATVDVVTLARASN